MSKSPEIIRKQEIEALSIMIDLSVPNVLDSAAASRLKEAVRLRYSRCPKMAAKPFCAKCPIHCFSTEESEQIRAVMKTSGMKMFLHHPLLCLRHLFNDLH